MKSEIILILLLALVSLVWENSTSKVWSVRIRTLALDTCINSWHTLGYTNNKNGFWSPELNSPGITNSNWWSQCGKCYSLFLICGKQCIMVFYFVHHEVLITSIGRDSIFKSCVTSIGCIKFTMLHSSIWSCLSDSAFLFF